MQANQWMLQSRIQVSEKVFFRHLYAAKKKKRFMTYGTYTCIRTIGVYSNAV